jgi:hypothetical protein
MEDMEWNIDKTARQEIFDYCAIHDPDFIELKEFLAALTVGVLLEPNLLLNMGKNSETDTTSGTLETKQQSNIPSMRRILVGIQHANFHEMLQHIITAYLLFDTEAHGVIRKSDVDKAISVSEGLHAANSMLSRERWNELVSVYVCSSVYSILS